MEFDFQRPEWWPVCVAAILPFLLGLWALRQRLRGLRALCEPRHLGRLFPALGGRADALAWLKRRALLRALLGGLSVLLLGAALVGPTRGFALVPVEEKRIDVVVALDTSRSMLVEDVPPSRLARAKAEIGALLDVMQGERVALVGFAGGAREVTPLTRDLDTSRYFLERMGPDDNRKGGTDLAAAIRHSVDLFEEGSGANQAIVLVTDGEDLTGEGLSAAERAKERGIEVHVLGMGTALGGKVPDGEGGFVADPEDPSGRSEVISRLSPDSLRAITDATGGIYLQAKGRVLPLEQLYTRAIAPLEGREVVDGKERVPRDRYQWPLALGILCLLLEAGLRDGVSRVGSRRAPRPSSLQEPTEGKNTIP